MLVMRMLGEMAIAQPDTGSLPTMPDALGGISRSGPLTARAGRECLNGRQRGPWAEQNGRAARWARRLPVLVLLLLLLVWPLTHRYTSIGVDTETQQGELVEGRHYRLRWPGDGSVMVGWIDEHRSAGEGRPSPPTSVRWSCSRHGP